MFSFKADNAFLLKDVSVFIDPVEIYDKSTGQLLGVFVPANLERCKEIKAREAAAPMSKEEIERRLAAPERVAHEDMWRRIREVDAENKRRIAAGQSGFTNEEAVAYVRALRERDRANGVVPVPASSLPEAERCPSP